MKSLTILPPDKSHIFYSTLDPKLVRTGVIADGSCFFHALLYAISSSYRKLSHPERVEYVRKYRGSLASKFTMKQWKRIGGGELFRMTMMILLEKLLKDDETMSELSKQWTSTSLRECTSILSTLLDQDAEPFVKRAAKLGLSQLQQHIEHAWVDEYCLEYISNSFQYNFYFIRADTRDVYKRFISANHDLYIVFCWINDSHYEIIGRLHNNRTVLRQFENSDPFIRALSDE
jgi:hypothetical protein